MARIYFINGFLDVGKTTFIKELMVQDYFKIDGTTLLLLCEEGDEEYDEKLLDEHNVSCVNITKEEDFNPENIATIEMKYKPKRVVVEFNGMWNRKDLEFPWYWEDLVEITIFDANTFEIYTKNMKSIVAEQVRHSLMAIINRCDNYGAKLAAYRRSIKAVNQDINVVFYDSQGEMSTRLEDDLPYNLEDDDIDISTNTYATFYLDIMENLDRYLGKNVHFTGMVMKKSADKPSSSIIGRFVMTCCSADLSLFGFVCDYKQMNELELDDWVEVTAVVDKDYMEKYNLWYPVLYVEQAVKCEAPENKIVETI